MRTLKAFAALIVIVLINYSSGLNQVADDTVVVEGAYYGLSEVLCIYCLNHEETNKSNCEI